MAALRGDDVIAVSLEEATERAEDGHARVVRGRSGILRLGMRLAAIDLDGTLLRSDGTISQRSRTAIRAVRDAGIVVVIVTARGPGSIVELAQDAGIDGSAICSNGGLIVDLALGRGRFASALLETATAIQLVHGLRERLPGIASPSSTRRSRTSRGSRLGLGAHRPERGVGDAVDLLGDPPTKLIVLHARPRQARRGRCGRTRVAGDDATVVQSGGEAVEVTAVWRQQGCGPRGASLPAGSTRSTSSRSATTRTTCRCSPVAAALVAVATPRRGARDRRQVTASNDDDGVAIVLGSATASSWRDRRGLRSSARRRREARGAGRAGRSRGPSAGVRSSFEQPARAEQRERVARRRTAHRRRRTGGRTASRVHAARRASRSSRSSTFSSRKSLACERGALSGRARLSRRCVRSRPARRLLLRTPFRARRRSSRREHAQKRLHLADRGAAARHSSESGNER